MAKTSSNRKLQKLANEIRGCVKCPLCESRTLAVPGDGKHNAKVMIIGEAPGREEDQTGLPFVGAAGRFLDSVLVGSDISRADIFITNTVKCRPPKNRTPRNLEVETCTANYLFAQIELINPLLVMLLGSVAVKKMLGLKTVNEARGRVIEQDGRRFLAGYHPASSFYREDLAAKVREDFAFLRQQIEILRLPNKHK
jgi:uracil-DNA glycosylase